MNHSNIKLGFILILIAQLLMIMCNLLSAFTDVMVELRVFDLVLAIASSIVCVIGVNLIKKDENRYTKAYHWAFISLSVVLVLLVLQKAFVDNKQLVTLLEEIEKVLSDICEFITASLIIKESINTFKDINDLVEYGEKTHFIHKIGFIAGMIFDLIHGILIEYPSLVVTLISLLAFVLLITADVRYFLYLNKIKKNIY